jgi:hypothetical protein
MLKSLITKLRRIAQRPTSQDRRAAIEAWSLFMGRDAAELWLEALISRDAAPLSNA